MKATHTKDTIVASVDTPLPLLLPTPTPRLTICDEIDAQVTIQMQTCSPGPSVKLLNSQLTIAASLCKALDSVTTTSGEIDLWKVIGGVETSTGDTQEVTTIGGLEISYGKESPSKPILTAGDWNLSYDLYM
ncbi:hypothetical protein FRB90_006636 [Tulasnella sp. 427]|nr:hypothetical protein FRB90_006636 [Tulasnella sp. 427]